MGHTTCASESGLVSCGINTGPVASTKAALVAFGVNALPIAHGKNNQKLQKNDLGVFGVFSGKFNGKEC